MWPAPAFSVDEMFAGRGFWDDVQNAIIVFGHGKVIFLRFSGHAQ
jgi:hypothetical protein